MKKKSKIIIGVIVVIIVIAVIGGSSSNNTNSVTDSTANNNSSENVAKNDGKDKNYEVGETAIIDGVEVTLTDVSESAGSTYIKPADGNVFVICEFAINNNSKNDINVSSIASFEAYCDDMSINQSIMAISDVTDNRKQLDGSVACGKKMSGIIGYEVPENWENVEIIFSPSFWGSKSVKFITSK